MVGLFKSLRRNEVKENVKKPDITNSSFDKKLEFNKGKIDLDNLVSKIKKFLEKSESSFDYATYSIIDLPENKGKYFKIEYGLKNPTFTFYITLEQNDNNLKIYDHIPANYSAWAEMIIWPEINLQKTINVKTYRINLWNFIGKTAKDLEN